MMKLGVTYGVLLLLFFAQQRDCQLFRFCHRGVFHQILEDDCPYGVLFSEQLQVPCFYTMSGGKSGGGAATGWGGDEPSSGNVPRIWPTLCEDPYLFMPKDVTDETIGDGYFIAKKNGEIRMIQFANPSNSSDYTTSTIDLVSFQSCEDRCYRNIFEDTRSSLLYTSSSHEASDSLEAPHQVTRPKLPPKEQSAIVDQTLRLGDYLFEQIGSPDENPGPKLRITEIFKRSIKILAKSCQAPFVSSNFVNRVLYGFLFLVMDSGIGEIEDISVEEFEEIMVALNACDEKNPEFRLEGVVCESSATVKEVIKILPNGSEYTAPFQLSPKIHDQSTANDYDIPGGDDKKSPNRGYGSFPYDELDVFTEAAWSAVQVTHATCFATFKPNVNMHHRYVSAMEQLFNSKIQDRWRNPTILVDPRMWGTWFLTDVDLAFVNLQACIRASYLDAPFTMRLDRPIDPVRSKGAPGDGDKRVKRDVGRKRVKRSADSDMTKYWNEYHANGGIRSRLGNTIQCFHNPDDKDAAVQLLKDQCSNIASGV